MQQILFLSVFSIFFIIVILSYATITLHKDLRFLVLWWNCDSGEWRQIKIVLWSPVRNILFILLTAKLSKILKFEYFSPVNVSFAPPLAYSCRKRVLNNSLLLHRIATTNPLPYFYRLLTLLLLFITPSSTSSC